MLAKCSNRRYDLGNEREMGQRGMLGDVDADRRCLTFTERVERGGKERENESLVRRTQRELAHELYRRYSPRGEGGRERGGEGRSFALVSDEHNNESSNNGSIFYHRRT